MMHDMRAPHRDGRAGGWWPADAVSVLPAETERTGARRIEAVVSVRTREPRAWNGEQVNACDHDDVRSPSTWAARILLAGAVLGVVSVLAVGCGSPSYPGQPLETLPPHTAGAVSLGGLGVETSGGRTLVFAFDDQGTVLGRLEGERVDSTRVLFSADSLVTVTGEAVTVLTEQGRTDIPIDEHTISAFSHDPVSGAATVWFVQGRTNNFVAIGADQQVRQGSVDGMVHTAAYCGDRQFAIIENLPTATGPRTSRFYELPASGKLQLLGQWQTEPDHSWASSTSACAPDGRSVLAFNTDYSAASMNAGGPVTTLVGQVPGHGVRRRRVIPHRWFRRSTRVSPPPSVR